VYGGSSDYLLPTLHAGGNGCVTGLGNVFPKSTSSIYDLWAAGKLDEARKLQDEVANAEWACKKSLACTKYGAWWYVGRKLGLKDAENKFMMRKPYVELGAEMKTWSIETMSVLESTENRLIESGASSTMNGTH
jgi:4-hydroxy-2-oxoglutarate aldolase